MYPRSTISAGVAVIPSAYAAPNDDNTDATSIAVPRSATPHIAAPTVPRVRGIRVADRDRRRTRCLGNWRWRFGRTGRGNHRGCHSRRDDRFVGRFWTPVHREMWRTSARPGHVIVRSDLLLGRYDRRPRATARREGEIALHLVPSRSAQISRKIVGAPLLFFLTCGERHERHGSHPDPNRYDTHTDSPVYPAY